LLSGAVEELRRSGILNRTAKASVQLPATTNLINLLGPPFDLAALALVEGQAGGGMVIRAANSGRDRGNSSLMGGLFAFMIQNQLRRSRTPFG
jgi:hypothetical protein